MDWLVAVWGLAVLLVGCRSTGPRMGYFNVEEDRCTFLQIKRYEGHCMEIKLSISMRPLHVRTQHDVTAGSLFAYNK
ncbi:hypothetical protein F4805DRAFT_171836 [Annulohypoxylon moriforme]|nr:hypothetical protein F4805DRAFT_171836 [Annulohypoxylon moriforme]